MQKKVTLIELPAEISSKQRFTLIELLVVIAIIAILMSILLPAMRTAKEAGRATICMSNASQIGRGHLMYLDDFDGFFARQWDVGVGYWTYALVTNNYMGSVEIDNWIWLPEIFGCPSRQINPRAKLDRPSWGLNESISEWGAGGSTYKLSSIKDPSATFMLVESIFSEGGSADWGSEQVDGYDPAQSCTLLLWRNRACRLRNRDWRIDDRRHCSRGCARREGPP